MQTGHYFTFCLPFAGINVEWEILFDSLNPSRPPDFICSEDIECNPDTYTRVMEDWDFKSVDCLAKLIKDLNGIYQEYQVRDYCVLIQVNQHSSSIHLIQYAQILGFPNAADHLHSLMNAGVLERNMEICFIPKERRINLLVKLDVNDQELPICSEVGRLQVYAGLLYVLGTDGSILSHSLIVSPYLETVLGSHLDQLRLANSPTQSVDPCILHDLTGSLDALLSKIREDHTRQRRLVAAIIDLYPNNVTFYDKSLYSSITLLFTLNNARYVVHLKLDDAMELVLFAMDHHIKVAKDENVVFNESEAILFPEDHTSPDFLKNIHELLETRIKKFMAKAANLPPT